MIEYLGIDIGGTNIRVGAIDEKERLVCYSSQKTLENVKTANLQTTENHTVTFDAAITATALAPKVIIILLGLYVFTASAKVISVPCDLIGIFHVCAVSGVSEDLAQTTFHERDP